MPLAVKAVPLRASRVGQNAVEHVDPAGDEFEQLRRSAEAHRVARFVVRQERLAPFHRLHHLRLRFTDAHTPDRIAIESNLHGGFRARPAQIFEGAPLHDPKEKRCSGGRVGRILQGFIAPR